MALYQLKNRTVEAIQYKYSKDVMVEILDLVSRANCEVIFGCDRLMHARPFGELYCNNDEMSNLCILFYENNYLALENSKITIYSKSYFETKYTHVL